MPAVEWTLFQIDAPNKPLLTATDVATLFGYDSESSVKRLVELGQLPAPLKRGGVNVWAREDVILCALLIKAWDRLPWGAVQIDQSPAIKPKVQEKRPKAGEPLNTPDPAD